MQAPFVVLTWAPPAAAGRAMARAVGERLADGGWTIEHAGDGVAVWGRASRPAPVVADADLVIVGRRFPRPGAAPQPRPPSGPLPQRARTLCEECWGPYVAVLRDPATDRWHVFRDPSGAVEAFTWPLADLQVTASGLRRLPPGLLPARIGLDWTVIADLVRRPASRDASVGLAGVHGVAPGVLQPAGAGADRAERLWRPKDWVGRGCGEAAAEARLTGTLRAVVEAQVGAYGRVATEASGGLDSSIVNAAVAEAGLAGRVVAALHYVGDRREADERAWAAALCERLGLPFVPIDRAPGPVAPQADFAALSRDARPAFGALDAFRDRDTAARLRAGRAQALVTGKGGDALFFQMPSARVIGDLWRDHGWRALGHPLNGQVARWLRRSVWAVWREAFAEPGTLSGRPARFAGPALADLPPAPPHPWLADLEDVPAGKRVQILALTTSLAGQGAHRRGRAADIVQPLLSKPMMELCLSIPSWALVRGGRDRGLARAAFAGWLPDAVVQRRAKGALTSLYARRAAASAPALREHLLHGVLVDAGLLDRRAVEAALDPDALIRRLDGVDLIAAAALESWVRYWQTRVPDAPAAVRWSCR
ncbi:asparagine synthase C-terminal domain-containing protein [Phenylobacterium sp.]|uniref:asparagine synthase-related protein n=1 Tax=Phenylobacterium sp. TaxID=1871053 RepID=UPI0025FC9455|nr:asparagine synthase C-terminal domain-containing protein [Phenylobacterium sp.]